MAISDNYVPVKELGNGVTVDFGANWSVLSASFLRVFLEDVVTGVQVLQAEGADYTLVFSDSGFTVTFLVAPTSADYAVVAREVAQDQTDPYTTSKGFQGPVLESSLDKLTAITQDMQDDLDRAPKTQVGDAPLVFPAFSAGLNLGWDTVTEGLIAVGVKTLAEIDAAVDLVEAVTPGSGVLVSSADTTIGFLDTKLVAGTNTTFTINNPGAAETMTIDVVVPAASETVAGIVEAATTAEMNAGTANKFPDAATVKAYVNSADQLLHIQEQASAGSAGSAPTVGSFVKKTLSTVVTNEITGASLASDQITLPAGTYFIDAKSPVGSADNHQALLYNVTDAANEVLGSSARSNSGTANTNSSYISGRFTIAGEKDFEIRHRADSATGPYAANFGVTEIYTDVKIWTVLQ